MCALHIMRKQIDKDKVEVTAIEDLTNCQPAMYCFVINDLGNPEKLVVSRGDVPLFQFTFPARDPSVFEYKRFDSFDPQKAKNTLRVYDWELSDIPEGMHAFGKDNSYLISNWYPEGTRSALALHGNPKVSDREGAPIVFRELEKDEKEWKYAYFGWSIDQGIQQVLTDRRDVLPVIDDTLRSKKDNPLKTKINIEKMILFQELAKLNLERQHLALIAMRRSLEAFQREE